MIKPSGLLTSLILDFRKYIKQLAHKLDAQQQEFFKKNTEVATMFFPGKLIDLQLFFGDNTHKLDSRMVFPYYKGSAATQPFCTLVLD
uniref:Uncharacterized protein n=1 Tax=Tanacetum cinerariifolium TaxID=118510 RepID=A0A6L2LYA1_TANCI|nr:hypothetical protein [Tanacetum cinerariifolium]